MYPSPRPTGSFPGSPILLFMRARKPLAWRASEDQKPNTPVVKIPPMPAESATTGDPEPLTDNADGEQTERGSGQEQERSAKRR